MGFFFCRSVCYANFKPETHLKLICFFLLHFSQNFPFILYSHISFLNTKGEIDILSIANQLIAKKKFDLMEKNA